MKRLELVRNRGWYGMIRALVIEVDGVEVGRVRSGRTLSIDVADDAVELQGRMDWAKSEPLSLADLPDGAVIDIHMRMKRDAIERPTEATLPARFVPRPYPS